MQRTSPIYYCIVPHCKSVYTLDNKERHFFRLPSHEPYRTKWIEELSIDEPSTNNSVRVCDLHFDTKFFTSTLRQRLIKYAIPSNQQPQDENYKEGEKLQDDQTSKTKETILSNKELVSQLDDEPKDNTEEEECIESVTEPEENIEITQTDIDPESEMLEIFEVNDDDNLESIVFITCEGSEQDEDSSHSFVCEHQEEAESNLIITNGLDYYEEVIPMDNENDENGNTSSSDSEPTVASEQRTAITEEQFIQQVWTHNFNNQISDNYRVNKLKCTVRKQQKCMKQMSNEISVLKQHVRFLRRRVRRLEKQ